MRSRIQDYNTVRCLPSSSVTEEGGCQYGGEARRWLLSYRTAVVLCRRAICLSVAGTKHPQLTLPPVIIRARENAEQDCRRSKSRYNGDKPKVLKKERKNESIGFISQGPTAGQVFAECATLSPFSDYKKENHPIASQMSRRVYSPFSAHQSECKRKKERNQSINHAQPPP